MKYPVILALLSTFTSFSHAQTYKVQQCLIENGMLKTIAIDYDAATGNYSINVSGTKMDFDKAYPVTSRDYAGSASWYINNEPVMISGKKYIKYGLPRILGTNEIEKLSAYNGVGVYVEAGTKGEAEVIYVPSRRGCEFQPYQKEIDKSGPKKIYYDEEWKVSSKTDAAYYRLITLNAAGEPVSLVRDYYITGEKQWEGKIIYLDPNDNNKDITEGVNTWFHKNGKKAAEVTKVNGKEQGLYKSWSDKGILVEEAQYSNGLLHGYRKTYLPNGKLSATEHYTNGNRDVK